MVNALILISAIGLMFVVVWFGWIILRKAGYTTKGYGGKKRK